jgi:carbamoyltransferase
MKERVNSIKRREPFRPFAPAVLQHHARDFFDLHNSSLPYMQFAEPCTRADQIPAVVHVDGTSRVQTVSQTDTSELYKLLSAFHERTNCPVLLNTSLNTKREPILDTQDDLAAFTVRSGVAIF